MNSGSRKLIFFVLTIGVAYLSYAYMIKPANTHLAEEKGRLSNMRSKLEELEKATLTANSLGEQLERVEEAIKIFESKLPPSSEIHKILENVTVIAQRHGLKPKTISTKDRKVNNGYIEQPINMELQGNFNSYYSFLLELEKMDRITKIRSLTLRKKSHEEGHAVATFVVSIFFQDANA